MEKQSELCFTTGEFVRILGVGKHTLFHYDEIGLSFPAIEEESGYRYYFVWQMGASEVIRALQESGMSLGEVKEYMENHSPERFMSMIDGKKCQIDEETWRLKNMKRFIPHEEESARLATNTVLDEPRLVGRDREYLPVSDISVGLERKAAAEIAEHARVQERYNGAVGAVGFICLGEDLERSIHNRCMKVYTRLDKKTVSHRVQNWPEGTYVGLCSRGHLWNMKKLYHLITTSAGERGIRLGKIWYEDLVLDELTAKAYGQYIAKVMASVGNP